MKGNYTNNVVINNKEWSGKRTIKKYLKKVLDSSIVYIYDFDEDRYTDDYYKKDDIEWDDYDDVLKIFEHYSGKKIDDIKINHTEKIRNYNVKFSGEDYRLYSYLNMFKTENSKLIIKLREYIRPQICAFRKTQQLPNGKYICAVDGLEYDQDEIEVDHVVEFSILVKNFIEIFGPLEKETFSNFKRNFSEYHSKNAVLQMISRKNHIIKTRDFFSSFNMQ